VRISDFDYSLPPELIAQRPAEPRDSSRLMVYHRASDQVEHRLFRDLPQYLRPGDALVINDTRVLPARLHGRKVPGGGRVELLLLRRRDEHSWEALVGGKGLRQGRRLAFPEGLEAEIMADLGGSRRLVRFSQPLNGLLERLGEPPLPPYIHQPLRSPQEYQTVFARQPGSVAAPTAGLHFTPELLARIQAMGVHLVRITLHIGLDTFAPVREQDPRAHPIHREWCSLSEAAAETLNRVSSAGGRVIAVGTTCVRTLETSALRAAHGRRFAPYEGETDLYILPGHRFRGVDAMITNFHLPRSTLLLLVSAFIGRQKLLQLYQLAIERRYRFYSFGDAMLIL
jgi:S-adenosylmethionine:tRNA ribosyltransferase-isomerase